METNYNELESIKTEPSLPEIGEMVGGDSTKAKLVGKISEMPHGSEGSYALIAVALYAVGLTEVAPFFCP